MLNRPNYGGKVEIVPVAIVLPDGTEEDITGRPAINQERR